MRKLAVQVCLRKIFSSENKIRVLRDEKILVASELAAFSFSSGLSFHGRCLRLNPTQRSVVRPQEGVRNECLVCSFAQQDLGVHGLHAPLNSQLSPGSGV